MSIKGDIRADGKRFDGFTWREVGLNHHMNDKGLIYYKRKYRTLKGYLNTGGNIHKIKGNIADVSDIGKVVTMLYDQQPNGYIYAISNPAWEGWIKIGMAVDSKDRCNSYQTSSPFRDYKVEVSVPVTDRRKAEGEAHKKAKELASEYAGEWFKISVEKTKEIIQELK
jgi:hypothetical protein